MICENEAQWAEIGVNAIARVNKEEVNKQSLLLRKRAPSRAIKGGNTLEDIKQRDLMEPHKG